MTKAGNTRTPIAAGLLTKRTRAARIDKSQRRATRRRVAVPLQALTSPATSCPNARTIACEACAKETNLIWTTGSTLAKIAERQAEMNLRLHLQRSPAGLAVGLACAESAFEISREFAPRIPRKTRDSHFRVPRCRQFCRRHSALVYRRESSGFVCQRQPLFGKNIFFPGDYPVAPII